jgi:hypothetical protein
MQENVADSAPLLASVLTEKKENEALARQEIVADNAPPFASVLT